MAFGNLVEMAYDTTTAPSPTEEKDPSSLALVKVWQERIKSAKKHWDKDFNRMREDMAFCAGYQWPGQTKMDDDRYTANLINTFVNNKVASLYARDPRAVAKRRKRLDFQIWDGRIESLQQALMSIQNSLMTGVPDAASAALIQDFASGRLQRDLVDRIGKTLEIGYRYQTDSLRPRFKLQMKQAVRRTVVCGVSYARVAFEADGNEQLTSESVGDSPTERMGRLSSMAKNFGEDGIDENDPDVKEGEQIVRSLEQDLPEVGIDVSRRERLVFDFLPATSVIVDPKCRSLKGFIGARWIALEYNMTVGTVEDWFHCNVQGQATEYTADGEEKKTAESQPENKKDALVCVYEIIDRATKSCYYICAGYKDFLSSPEPVEPKLRGFWPVVALTFNDIESEGGKEKTSIYPPSDVQLLKSAQREWNRSREGLRKHRIGNTPQWITAEGWMTEDDKDLLQNGDANRVLFIKGQPPGADLSKALIPRPSQQIDPAVYDTSPLVQDMLVTGGNQEASVPASSKSTATAATINEQQRVTKTSSNVDDLDDFLSELADMGSEVMIRQFSEDVIAAIVGPGYAWPTLAATKEAYVDELFLDVVAASSGRPNKALELANWQIAAPVLQAAGASPIFLAEETLKRLEETDVDIDKVFQMGVPAMSPMQPNQPGQGDATPQKNNQNPPATQMQPQPKVGRE